MRRGVASDAPAVSACVQAAYAHWVPIIGTKPGPMLDDYTDVLLLEQVFVAEVHARVVGVLVLSIADEGFLLDNVAVHPDFSSHGVGTHLLSLAEQEAAAQEYSSISLYTHESMEGNIERYRRLQYVEYDCRVERGFRRVYMRKSLEHSAV